MRSSRRPDYDAIRAFGAGAVALSHWFPDSAIGQSFGWGRMGVVSFFVLSGFFIGRILEAAERTPGATRASVLLSFAAHRSLRIVPPYLLLVAIVFLAGYPWVRLHIGAILGFAVNIDLARGALYGHAVHLWTISLEMQFYAAWAVAFCVLPKQYRPVLIFAALLLGIGWRLLATAVGADWVVTAYLLPGCVDSFAVGLWLVTRPQLRNPWGIALGAGLLLLALAALFSGEAPAARLTSPFYVAAQDILVAVATAATMLGMDSTPALRRSAPIVFVLGPLGLVSYGFYLWHYFAEPALGWHFVSPVAKAFAYTGFTLLATTASWFLVERPSQALRMHFPAFLVPSGANRQ